MCRSINGLAAAIGISAACLPVLALRPQPEAREGQPEDAPDMGAMLIDGLRDTPGCLGVDAADMMSGKKAIIAWFKDKNAVERWYYSDVHESLVADLAEADPEHEHTPLEHVTDEETPIMVIATITPSDKPQIEGIDLPISQISIELYAPLPGGVFYGGRLAPEGFVVPHIHNYSAANGD